MATEEKKAESIISRFKRVRITPKKESSNANVGESEVTNQITRSATPSKVARFVHSSHGSNITSNGANGAANTTSNSRYGFTPFQFPSAASVRDVKESASSFSFSSTPLSLPTQPSSHKPTQTPPSPKLARSTSSNPSSPRTSSRPSSPSISSSSKSLSLSLLQRPPSPVSLSIVSKSSSHPLPLTSSSRLSSSRPSSPSRVVSSAVRPPSPSSRTSFSRPSSPSSLSSSRPPTPPSCSPSPRRITGERERRGSFAMSRSGSVVMPKKIEVPNVKEIVDALGSLKDPKSTLSSRREAVNKLNDLLDEDAVAVQQRLRVFLHPLQKQLQREVEIAKEVCGFLQNLARIQVQDCLHPSYIYFASQMMNQLLDLLENGHSSKRNFVRATLDRLVDCTKTKETLNILLCCQHTEHPSQAFLVDLVELIYRAIQNWGPEFLKSSTVTSIPQERIIARFSCLWLRLPLNLGQNISD